MICHGCENWSASKSKCIMDWEPEENGTCDDYFGEDSMDDYEIMDEDELDAIFEEDEA